MESRRAEVHRADDEHGSHVNGVTNQDANITDQVSFLNRKFCSRAWPVLPARGLSYLSLAFLLSQDVKLLIRVEQEGDRDEVEGDTLCEDGPSPIEVLFDTELLCVGSKGPNHVANNDARHAERLGIRHPLSDHPFGSECVDPNWLVSRKEGVREALDHTREQKSVVVC